MDYTYRQLIADVERITNQYVGKVDKLAYIHIMEEIAAHIDTLDFVSELKATKQASVVIDTTENEEEYVTSTSNIGSKELITYHIEWKPDGRSSNGGTTGKILSINVKNHLADEFLDLDIVDIPQVIHYMLAKEHRERCLREIKELEEQLQSYKAGVQKFEDIMSLESWDKTMLYKDTRM